VTRDPRILWGWWNRRGWPLARGLVRRDLFSSRHRLLGEFSDAGPVAAVVTELGGCEFGLPDQVERLGSGLAARLRVGFVK
jgi:hypothetical protein